VIVIVILTVLNHDDPVMLSDAVVPPASVARLPTAVGSDRSIPALVPPDLVAVRSLRMPGSPT
jgi:hypothetical protein